MEINKNSGYVKIFVAISFLIMIAVNALANILPINGVNTGQLSDLYPNLFTPAALTFSIWGVIYLLLAAYTVYQMGFFQGNGSKINEALSGRIGILFVISSIANGAWIFSWHYHLVPVSMILMLVILACLILINFATKSAQMTGKEKFFVRLPFSVYFGWITVATIANATVLLVSIGWKGFGLSEVTWTIIIILVGMAIGLIVMIKNRDIAYGLVFIWAYNGIWIKHTSVDGFSGQYPSVITTVIGCIALFAAAEVYLLIYKKRT